MRLLVVARPSRSNTGMMMTTHSFLSSCHRSIVCLSHTVSYQFKQNDESYSYSCRRIRCRRNNQSGEIVLKWNRSFPFIKNQTTKRGKHDQPITIGKYNYWLNYITIAKFFRVVLRRCYQIYHVIHLFKMEMTYRDRTQHHHSVHSWTLF